MSSASNNSIDLWSIHLPDRQNGEVKRCRDLLTADELERAAKFFRLQDAGRFILCRGLLRRILGEVLDTEPSGIAFERNENGKPFLPESNLEFNVSHSRDRLLVAITSGRSVGVDIEFRRSGINMDAIAGRWFAPGEREFFQKSEFPQETFFDIWAKKEAYVKALGIGIFKELHAFAVPAGEKAGFPNLGKNGEWFFQTLEIDPAYAAALVSEAPVVPILLRTI